MNLPQKNQYCTKHKEKIYNLLCFDKSCKVKASLCSKCYQEDHKDCNPDKIMSYEEVFQKVIFVKSMKNGEEFRNTLKKVINSNKEMLVNRIGSWLDCLLKVFDKVDHNDFKNPVCMELIKNNFKMDFNKDSSTVNLIPKFDECSDEDLAKMVSMIDEGLKQVFDETMEKVLTIASLENTKTTMNNQQETIINESHTKRTQMEVIMNDNKTIMQSLQMIMNDNATIKQILKTSVHENTISLASLETKIGNKLQTIKEECKGIIKQQKLAVNGNQADIKEIQVEPFKNSIQDWIYDSRLEVSQCGNSVLFKNKAEDLVDGRRDIIYTLPLQTYAKFKVSFKSVDENNRHLGIWVCVRTDKNSVKPQIDTFQWGYCTYYYGYSFASKNLTGSVPTNNKSDSKGFSAGKEYFIEFWPGDKVRYYNLEGSLNIVGSFQGQIGPVHFCFEHLFHKTSYTVERLA